jgi:type IV secretion system protein TrbL
MPSPCDVLLDPSLCDSAGDAVGSAASSAAQAFVDAFADGFAKLVVTMTTFWVEVPTPAIGGGGSAVAQVQDSVYWVQGVILVLSLLYVAGKLALTRSGKVAGEAAMGLGTMVLVTGAGVAAIDVLAIAGDNWAAWIISRSTDGDMSTRLGAVTGGSADMAVLGMGLEFVIAFLGIISCIVQIFFLLARVGVLTVLAGTLPLAAAALSTPAGRAWFKRSIGWIIAFLLYKPAAALIYASAFSLTANGQDLLSVLSGLMLILLSVFALPALMRLAVPMVSAATGGGGGELAGAAAGVALASGARRVANSSSTGGATGGSGPGRISGGPDTGSGGPSSGGRPGSGPPGARPTGGSAAVSRAGAAGAGAGAATGASAVAGGAVVAAQAVKAGAGAAAGSTTGER